MGYFSEMNEEMGTREAVTETRVQFGSIYYNATRETFQDMKGMSVCFNDGFKTLAQALSYVSNVSNDGHQPWEVVSVMPGEVVVKRTVEAVLTQFEKRLLDGEDDWGFTYEGRWISAGPLRRKDSTVSAETHFRECLESAVLIHVLFIDEPVFSWSPPATIRMWYPKVKKSAR